MYLLAALVLTPSSAESQLVSIQFEYPSAEFQAGIEGVVGFEVDVAKNGKVAGCKITQTSGNADLDRQTCAQIRNTAQFKPATDSAGRPIKSTYKHKMHWTLPHPAPEPEPAASPQ